MGNNLSPDAASGRRGELTYNTRTRRILAMDSGGVTIGYIVLDHINWRAGSVEMRICIGEASFRGRGVGQAAIGLLLDSLRGGSLKEVYLRVNPENLRAVKCYAKCGFRKEGIIRATRSMPGSILLMSQRLA